MSRIKRLIVAAVASFPSAGLAQAFTFEDLPQNPPCVSNCPPFSVYFSIVQTLEGQTLTVTPLGVPGASFAIIAENPHVPLLGATSIWGLEEPAKAAAFFIPLRFSFLNPVSAITFAFGDNGGHDDSPARIQAFDAFNNLLGVFDTPYPEGKNDGATRTLTFGDGGASSFIVSSGGPLVLSGFYWEITASTPAALTAPEPAPVALVGSGLLLLGIAYRRRVFPQQRRSRDHGRPEFKRV